MSTLVGADVEILEALDFEESRECEVEGCGQEASFLIVTQCCGLSAQECQMHTVEVRMALARIRAASGQWLLCVRCDAEIHDVDILPLGGVS